MNAPFPLGAEVVNLVDLRDPGEVARIEGFVVEQGGSLFHRPAWLLAVQQVAKQVRLGTRRGSLFLAGAMNRAHTLVAGLGATLPATIAMIRFNAELLLGPYQCQGRRLRRKRSLSRLRLGFTRLTLRQSEFGCFLRRWCQR